MKKCLSVLFVLVVLFINNCGGGSEEQTYLATPTDEDEPFVAECEDHPDCYPDHSICVSGVCTGDPQPEELPNENVPVIGGEDATTATETTGSGPWGNPNYNGSDTAQNSDQNSEQNKNDSDQPEVPVGECLNDVDCDDADVCTFDNCVDAKCGNTQLWTDECGGEPDMPHTQCDVDTDCNDNNECTFDLCMNAGMPDNAECVNENVGWAKPCGNGLACIDGECLEFSCQTKYDCSSTAGIYLCIDVECVDGHCNLVEPQNDECGYGSCDVGTDCNDNNECTINVCYSGQCFYDAITNCKPCTEDAECGEGFIADYWCDDEGNVNTASQPKCVSGACGQDVVVTYCGEQGCDECNECATDADCNDSDATTTDICWVGECFHAAVDVECYAGDSCDDNNGCTTDYCDKGYCNHIGSDGCKTCELQSDCNDGNVCTIDSCVDATLTCSHIDNCQYAGSWTKLSCETDADCAGSGLGEFCVFSQASDVGLCQECSNLVSNLHPCSTGKICKWGIVGEEGNSLSHYHCENECNCDDGNACTTDTCNANGACLHETMEYCEPCKTAADCDDSFLWYHYFCEDANYQTTYSEAKCIAGICNQTISSVKCKYGCDNSLCNKCAVNADCDDKNTTTTDSCVYLDPNGAKECVHESAELKCSFSSCPGTMQNVVIWYGNNQTATVKCDGAELFKVSPETLCLWGAKNPVFKYNLWNGGDAWSSGGEAQVNCNQATTVTPDPNLGTAGVQVVSFTDLLCEF